MKVSLLPNENAVRLESENTHDVFHLGKLASALKNAQHSSGNPTKDTHSLQCDSQDFLELSLKACGC